jgi:N-acetylglucosaminyl-diphospho-decaprenol L-rhamnosyltransferase
MISLKKVLPQPVREVFRRSRSALLSIGLPYDQPFVASSEEIAASEKVSVVVAINDAPDVTYRCLASLERFAGKAEIILADDGSELPQTLEVVREFSSDNDWKVVRHQHKQGHSRACEAGANIATRPYLCLLNSDTVVTPWSWAGPTEPFEDDERIVVSGPSTSWAATRQMHPRAMHCRHYWNDRQIWAFAKLCTAAVPPQTWVTLPSIGGFAFFVRQTAWNKLNGFDINLPDYGNESEFCRRVAKAGLLSVWSKNSYIHHLGHQSYGRIFGKATIDRKAKEATSYINAVHGEAAGTRITS